MTALLDEASDMLERRSFESGDADVVAAAVMAVVQYLRDREAKAEGPKDPDDSPQFTPEELSLFKARGFRRENRRGDRVPIVDRTELDAMTAERDEWKRRAREAGATQYMVPIEKLASEASSIESYLNSVQWGDLGGMSLLRRVELLYEEMQGERREVARLTKMQPVEEWKARALAAEDRADRDGALYEASVKDVAEIEWQRQQASYWSAAWKAGMRRMREERNSAMEEAYQRETTNRAIDLARYNIQVQAEDWQRQANEQELRAIKAEARVKKLEDDEVGIASKCADHCTAAENEAYERAATDAENMAREKIVCVRCAERMAKCIRAFKDRL